MERGDYPLEPPVSRDRPSLDLCSERGQLQMREEECMERLPAQAWKVGEGSLEEVSPELSTKGNSIHSRGNSTWHRWTAEEPEGGREPEGAPPWYIPEQVTSPGWTLAHPLDPLSSTLGIGLNTIMNVKV